MADKLIVRDFGPIKNAELDIKKTTVLIGPQGSGKSTLAKLVATATNISWHFMLTDDYDAKLHLSDFGIQNFVKAQSYFFYQHNLTEVKLSYSKNEFGENADSTNPLFQVQNSKLKDIISNFRNKKIDNDQKSKEIQELIFRPIYVPSERLMLPIVRDASLSFQLNKIPLPMSLLYFGSEFEQARKKVSILKTLLDGVEYRFVNGEDRVIFKGGNLNLSETASGYQAIIPMQVIIENLFRENNQKFIVEEPELNLYPPTQKSLISFLTSRCTLGDNQLLLTTHSPYVLSSLNNLLFAYKVAQKHPEQAEEIAKIIPKESWLNPDDFAAYFVADGTVRSIVNPKTGLIAENELDGVSEDIGDEFDALMEIYRTTNETSH